MEPEHRYQDSPTLAIVVSDTRFAIRDLGPKTAAPLILLTHLGANLENWDPRIIDSLSQNRRVLAVDYRGVGNSEGHIRATIEEMADDVVSVIRAPGYPQVDMFGQSMGGMVAQVIAARTPQLLDHLILESTGPAEGQESAI